MIVPENRLLFYTGAAVPFIGLAAAIPKFMWLAGLPVAFIIILAVVDAFSALSRLDGISLHFPEIIRMSKDREGRIDIRIENERLKLKHIKIGMAFPRHIDSKEKILTAELPAESQASTLSWACTAVRRGRYQLEKCHIEASSRLGLWAVRKPYAVQSEIRVYPNIFSERKNMAALFLSRGGIGIHAQRQIGKGRDFEKLREYTPGDSFEDIHWKATAKRGHPVTKVFQIERTQEVYVIIDASRLSARNAALVSERRMSSRGDDPGATTIVERFVTSALIMGLAAERQGDLFGLLTFSDRVLSFIRAKNGKAHYDSCREALYTLQPQGVTPDFDEVLSFIGMRLRRRALLVFLTNMDDPVLAESLSRNIHMISRKHLVLVNMISPPDSRALFSSPDVHNVDDVYRRLGGHFLWSGLRETEKMFKEKNVGFAALENDRMCTQLVSQYLNVKQRQAL